MDAASQAAVASLAVKAARADLAGARADLAAAKVGLAAVAADPKVAVAVAQAAVIDNNG